MTASCSNTSLAASAHESHQAPQLILRKSLPFINKCLAKLCKVAGLNWSLLYFLFKGIPNLFDRVKIGTFCWPLMGLDVVVPQVIQCVYGSMRANIVALLQVSFSTAPVNKLLASFACMPYGDSSVNKNLRH